MRVMKSVIIFFRIFFSVPTLTGHTEDILLYCVVNMRTHVVTFKTVSVYIMYRSKSLYFSLYKKDQSPDDVIQSLCGDVQVS